MTEVIDQILKSGSDREKIVTHLFEFIKDKKAAAINFAWNSIKDIPETSELDLVTKKITTAQIIRFLKAHPLVINATVINKSSMKRVELRLRDGGYLSLNLTHDFKWKWIQFMKAEQILTRSAIVSGIKKTWIADDLWYCIHLYQLNGKGIPSKYKSYFAKATASEFATVKHEVESRYQFTFHDLEELFHPVPQLQVNIIKFLKSQIVNSGLSALVRKGILLFDKFFHRGMEFTAIGSEEMGKSTIVIN